VFPGTFAVGGVTETEIGSGGAIVIAAEADLAVSAIEVALSVTATFGGTPVGGVYVMDEPLAVLMGETEPHAGEQGAPPCVRDQLTPPLLPSF